MSEFEYCTFDAVNPPLRLVFAAVGFSQGTPAQYNDGCLHPAISDTPPCALVSGVGSWAYFVAATQPGDEQLFSAGNEKYMISLSGDAQLDVLKELGTTFLASLPR